MKAEKSRIPITDFIKVWCELCRIRIDAHEERTEVGGKTYHPDGLRFAAFLAVPNSEIEAAFERETSDGGTVLFPTLETLTSRNWDKVSPLRQVL